MRKLLWGTVSVVLFLFGISHIEAKTLFQPTSSKNGNVQINLKFEEGYVGGIDLILELSEEVVLTNVNWDSSILNSYTKRYHFDPTNHTVRIIITTGDQTKNLVDKNGMMRIGTLVLKSRDGKTIYYTVDIDSLTMVNATYSSIVKKDLELSGKNQFVYKEINHNDGNNNNENNGNSSDQEELKPDHKNPENNGSANQQQPSDSNDEMEETPNETDDQPIDNDISNGEQSGNDQTHVSNNDKNQSKNEITIKKNKFTWKEYTGIGFIIILVVTLLAMITKKIKN